MEMVCHLAFVAPGSEQIVGVCWRAQDSTIVEEGVGEADPTVIRSQVVRILSLDIDDRDWPLVGKRDLVMGGFRHATRDCDQFACSLRIRRLPGHSSATASVSRKLLGSRHVCLKNWFSRTSRAASCRLEYLLVQEREST